MCKDVRSAQTDILQWARSPKYFFSYEAESAQNSLQIPGAAPLGSWTISFSRTSAIWVASCIDASIGMHHCAQPAILLCSSLAVIVSMRWPGGEDMLLMHLTIHSTWPCRETLRNAASMMGSSESVKALYCISARRVHSARTAGARVKGDIK
jgi:hypothetical protein